MEEHFKVLWSLSEEIAKEYMRAYPSHRGWTDYSDQGIRVYNAEKETGIYSVEFWSNKTIIEAALFRDSIDVKINTTPSEIKSFIEKGNEYLSELKKIDTTFNLIEVELLELKQRQEELEKILLKNEQERIK